MNCSTCKHWTDPGVLGDGNYWDEILHPTDEDTYEPKEMPFEVRECRHPAKTFCERPVERDGFGVCDGSTYMARLFTGPDFCCVRHEAAA